MWYGKDIMTALDWINAVVVAIGIPTVVGMFVLIGRKLETLDSVKREIDENIRPDLKDVRERFSALEGKAANLFESHSPISLTKKGMMYLEKSGLKDYIDANEDVLYKVCTRKSHMDTPYDVQQCSFDLFEGYKFPEPVGNTIKTFAFNQGISMDALRRTGAIYYRDKCLQKLGFKPEDLDE